MRGFRNVFTYGTLMIPEILEALTGRSFPSVDAVLEGYVRFMVQGRPYPGIRANIGNQTNGRLYSGVDVPSIEILDRFEGMLYKRQTLFVRVRDQRDQKGEVYVVKQEHEHRLSSQPWELQWFKDEWYKAYLQSCKEFRARLGKV